MGGSKKSKSSRATSKLSYKSEPSALVVPSFEGTDPKTIIFPEWSDQEYNAEKWDIPKAKTPKSKAGSRTSSEASSKVGGKTTTPGYFRDPHSYTLPETVSAYKWKKPEVLFPNMSVVVYKENSLNNYADLISGNKHLLNTEFFRVFISCINILEHMGYNDPWPMEGVTPLFTPNTTGEPWKPWHHIYATCKAGKGQKHKPQVNKLGKYAVRIYWLGAWRRIMVDDFLPVDQMDHILLPTSQVPEPLPEQPSQEVPADVEQAVQTLSPDAAAAAAAQQQQNSIDQSSPHSIDRDDADKKNKKKGKKDKKVKNTKKESKDETTNLNVVELWPFILCKALLKVSNLTWSPGSQMVDFSIVHSLTGWSMQSLHTTSLNPMELWDICTAYTEKFLWPSDRKSDSTTDSKKDKESKKAGKSKSSKSKKSKSSKGSKKSKKSKKGKKENEVEDIQSLPFCLIGYLADTRNLNHSVIPEISPCWSHYFLMQQTRTIPLEKPIERPELAKWKRFRWIEWAKSRGIYIEEATESYKFFKFISTFKKVADLIVHKIPSNFEVLQKEKPKKVVVPEEPKKTKKDKKSEKGSKKSKTTKKSSSKKSSKKSKKSKAERVSFEKPSDPSIWIDYNNICQFITKLHIFLKPSLFPTQIQITDLADRKALKPGKPDKKSKDKVGEKIIKKIIWPNKLKECRNEPLYMFLDGLDCKFLALTLCTAGNEEILQQKCLTVHCDLTSLWQKEFDLAKRSKMRIRANMLVEKYDWRKRNQVGKFAACIETVGTKSAFILLPPGRLTLRLCINTSKSYVISALCDVPLYLGTLEYVLECLPSESERLIQKCFDIGASFGKLVQSFGMEDFKQALLNWYSSYKPSNDSLAKKETTLIHEEFFKEFLRVIREKYPDCGDVMFALRILFLNPTIGFECPPRKSKQKKAKKPKKEKKAKEEVTVVWDDDECLSATEEIGDSHSEGSWEKKQQRAACFIQAFFKRIYTQKLREYHNVDHPVYMKIFETLKKIYKDIFNVDSRVVNLSQVFRNLLLRNEMLTPIRPKYVIYEDLQSVINIQLLTGTVTVGSDPWIPIARYEFFINSPIPEVVKIYLYSNASRYILRVFDNDTSVEVYRALSDVLVQTYECNEKGYTVLAYGWHPAGKVNYKLAFYTIKGSSKSPVIIPERQLQQIKLSDIYHANIMDCIAKCLVKIIKDVNVTIRFSCSWDEVQIKLRCVDSGGKVCQEIVGTKNIILPLVQLKHHLPEIREQSTISVSKKSSSSKSSRQSLTFAGKLKSKRNSDKGSTTGSIASKKSSLNNSVTSVKPSNTDCFYVVEAYVLKHSWPLTMEEWIESEKVKRRSLIGHSLFPVDSVGRKSSGFTRQRLSVDYATLPNPRWCLQTVCDKGDSISVTFDKRREREIKNIKMKWYEQEDRYERSKILREEFLHSHTFTRESASEYSETDEDSLYDESTTLLLENLPSRIEDATTRSVFESEPRSVTKPLRQSLPQLPPLDYKVYAYPEEPEPVKKKWFMSGDRGDSEEDYDFNDTSALRYAAVEGKPRAIRISFHGDSHECENVVVIADRPKDKPNLSLDGDDAYLKKGEDYEDDLRKMYGAVEEFEKSHMEFIQDMNTLREQSLERGHVLQTWFDDVRDESIGLLEYSYSLRGKYIERLLEAERERKAKETKDKSGKKGKKGKGSKASSKSSKKSSKKK